MGIVHFNAVQSLYPNFPHLARNGLTIVAYQTVSTCTHQEVRVEFKRQAKQFIDVSHPIANMDTACRVTLNRPGF
jgi:hypothetical protein